MRMDGEPVFELLLAQGLPVDAFHLPVGLELAVTHHGRSGFCFDRPV